MGLRKMVRGSLWDTASFINWLADELLCPDRSKRSDYRPKNQYPVGSLVCTAKGDVWQLLATGRWMLVEQDGEPIDPPSQWVNDVYCDICCDEPLAEWEKELHAEWHRTTKGECDGC